ncbi:zf-TFIIB domain-containing protein [Streptomyces sp. WI04-05B]|uniref:TFIIB-type zinc ribbon-containing protein n=1 Tax=Streptomyces TaxID=1883 RepID=UPI0029B82014|nr:MULTISPECIES: zf-TFIIB domain-containing protein [unclassified Streptomyces]MDX2540792.1 zf-TFIIB domain-containing protein [Streptomyces sp. WI04-05B]MDX2585909.1 zf-TFIIB domain-containing protein [Streptomyces sp. WI04-05A]MDX3746057.1 zf-TFIIB domain-containing protein [Streptomyces sp. AK08-02]
MQCPKCHAPMHTYNRNGVQIEQCSGCRGIFLDYGELEALTRVESQWSGPAAPPPPAPQGYPAAPAPAWGAPQGGHHGGHGGHGGHYGGKRHKSFGHMLFSS